MESIRELLSPGLLEPELVALEKVQAIEELVRVLHREYPDLDRALALRRILDRERLGSTGIGHGVAIPHCKMEGIDRMLCCFGRSLHGVEFQSLDGAPAHIFFLLIAPENAAGEHLRALALISGLCRSETFRQKVMQAGTADEIYALMTAST